MAGPLDGFRIIDLTNVISGPFCTMILGDQGADVIKVETPNGGDFVRSYGNQRNDVSATLLNNNRNKRSITINLKSPAGVDLLKRLVRGADVMIQNFRPGVVERLGIDEDAMRAVRADLIYVSISGFGESGPLSHKPVYDPIVQAVSGLASIQGGSDENRPRLIRTIIPDKLTSVTAAQAVTAALLARERGGEGQHVRLSMLDSVLAFLWSSDMASQTLVGDTIPQQRAASFIDLIYETKDGYMSVSTMNNVQWAALSRAVDRPEWLEDPRFRTPALRDTNINARLEMVQQELRHRTTAEWLRRLEAEHVPCAPVLTRNELVRHPQIEALDSLWHSEHPDAGPIRQARPAARFSRTSPELRRGAPRLGEHTDDVLGEIGLSADDIAALRAAEAIG